MSQNEIRLGPVSKIIEKNLAESQIREAQAKKDLNSKVSLNLVKNLNCRLRLLKH